MYRLIALRKTLFSICYNRILIPARHRNIRWNLCHTDHILKSPFVDAGVGEQETFHTDVEFENDNLSELSLEQQAAEMNPKVKIRTDKEGRGFCEIHLTKTHMNDIGTLHGGCISTLIDIVSAKGLFRTEEPYAVSIDLSVSFLAPALEGDIIIIESEIVKVTKHLAFLEAKLYKKADKTLVATGKQTLYMLDNPKYFTVR